MPETTCSTCSGGRCRVPEACHLPIELQPIKRRIFARGRRWLPTTREGWARVIGAGMGLGGFFLFAHDAVRHLFQ